MEVTPMDRLEDDCRQLRQKSIPETEATTAVQPTMTREEALIRANNGSEIDKELYQKISQVWGSKNGGYAHKKALRELIISGQIVLAKSFTFNRKWKN
jgi:hypothetical protein